MAVYLFLESISKRWGLMERDKNSEQFPIKHANAAGLTSPFPGTGKAPGLADEEEQKGEKYYQLLIEKAQDMITLLDSEGKAVYNSPSVKGITGYEADELMGRNLFELVHPDDLQSVIEAFKRGLQTPGATEIASYRFKHKDGSWRYFESVGNNLLHDPTIGSLVVNSRDITDRKLMEEELKKSEEHFRALIESALDIITIIDAEGMIVYMNPAVETLLGYSPEEVKGRSSFDFIHPSDVDKAAKIFANAVKDPSFSPMVEFRALHRNGSYRYFDGIGKNFLDHPAVKGIVISFRDITDRKIMEKELHNRNEELEAFAYSISHDLQTPAAVVEGYAKAVLEAGAEDRPALERECLENIVRGARRMSDLIDSLLQYAQAGHPEKQVERVDPAEVLRETLLDLKEGITAKGAEIRVDEFMPAVPVDPIKLHQVFYNLVGNALKHMGDIDQPIIEIGAAEGGRMITFHVRDNGMGIPSSLQKKIFEPFRHYSIQESPGLGIGLATVKRAVEAWMGRVWVESTPGEGTTFYFTTAAFDARPSSL
jgi:PAS domain S-box-containing protein